AAAGVRTGEAGHNRCGERGGVLALPVMTAPEWGAGTRFAAAERMAGYAGTAPRVRASGGKTRFGPARPDVNRYLKWAFVERRMRSASRVGAHRAATSVASTRGSLDARATRKPSGRWPGIWPKRRI